jgi:hypothetical protein
MRIPNQPCLNAAQLAGLGLAVACCILTKTTTIKG